MQKRLLLFLLFGSLALAVSAQNLNYTACPGCWNPDSLGNHRVVVHFDGPGSVVHVFIPWRRRDPDPAGHRIIVQDGRTGDRIKDVTVLSLTRESGELAFKAESGKGIYYIYYLPYRNEGKSNYPKGYYWRPDTTASAEWGKVAVPIHTNGMVASFQSIDSFNTFYPMEVIATKKETQALKAKYAGKPFLVFPEDREHPIRMRDDLPYRWIVRGPQPAFTGTADRGEYYAFQLGIYALQPLSDVRLQFSALHDAQGHTIPAGALECVNITGVTYDGHPFTKIVDVPADQVQALWCGIDVPASASPGVYIGKVSVTTGKTETRTIAIRLVVRDKVIPDGGAGEPAKMTRLKWLNSTLSQENTVIAPYTPLTIQGDTLINLLGRAVKLNPTGFPEQIQTFFSPENTEITNVPNNLLAENIHFHFTRKSDGKDIRLKPQGLQFIQKTPGTMSWQATSIADELKMDVRASLEFDGFLSYTVKVTALQDLDLKDIVMHIPFEKAVATYMMGLGQKGGYRPDSMYHWKWDVAHKNQDGAWIGAVNAGLQYSLRDERYVRPLNTNFYLQKPLIAPSSWANSGNGGIDVGIKGKSMLASNYSGPRQLKKGDTLYYNFNLLITPFHTLNTDAQWATRFYHKYDDPQTIKATGATVVNIHHATPINPWINYPFIEWKRMKGYIDTAHAWV